MTTTSSPDSCTCAYPLIFTMLPKRVNSNSLERIALLQRYVNLFDAESIDCLLADREFVGDKWIGWLNENHVRCWETETMFRALKSAGFNIEDTHLTDLYRISKLLLLVMIALVWCYDVGEYVQHNIREIKVKKHGRKAKSIFRYGLDIVTDFLLRDRNDYGISIPAFLSISNPLIVRH